MTPTVEAVQLIRRLEANVNTLKKCNNTTECVNIQIVIENEKVRDKQI